MTKPSPSDVIDLAAPKFVVAYGRGSVGKSSILRYLVERAQAAQRDIVIADADINPNAILYKFFSAERPEYADDVSVRDLFEGLVDGMDRTKRTVILDLGGGDTSFQPFAASLDLATLLDGIGIMPVIIHVLSPDVDDLAYLHAIESTKSFCPAQTILLRNEGRITSSRKREAAFADVMAHEHYKNAVRRGAREVWFPKLSCMQAVTSKHMPFASADKNMELGISDRQYVAMWRRAVEKELAPVVDWLP